MTTYLVTGGAGFIGSNFIRYVFDNDPAAKVINLDALTYAGVPATVSQLDEMGDHHFVKGDIRDPGLVDSLLDGIDAVVHFAAESHVDRSISGPSEFLTTNVVGTGVVIDAAARNDVKKFIHISTDEVYGSVAEGFALESAPLEPSSPYSASKAGSDLLVASYAVTYDYPAIITRCTNNYGPYQFPEKLISLFTTNLIDEKPIPLYGDGKNERDWLFVEDHCSAVYFLLTHGTPGEIYNIGANNQLPNVEIAHTLLQMLGKDENMLEYVTDRPGHDRRYAVDSSKLRSLGWSPSEPFEVRLEETVQWYRDNRSWWEPLKK